MPVSELDIARIRRWCEDRVPQRARYQVHLEVEVVGTVVTIVERRAPWDGVGEWSSNPRARLRFRAARWWLYWSDRNGRFHLYDLAGPWARISQALDELAADPTAIFWG